MGVAPVLGRTFLDEEDHAGHDREVILGYGLWQRKFGGDPGVVGRNLELNGASYAVVGVMPTVSHSLVAKKMPGSFHILEMRVPEITDVLRIAPLRTKWP